jgi:hypothetical protein
MIILDKKYWKTYYKIVLVIFAGFVWHYGNYGSKGEYFIAMLLVLIYWDLKEERK